MRDTRTTGRIGRRQETTENGDKEANGISYERRLGRTALREITHGPDKRLRIHRLGEEGLELVAGVAEAASERGVGGHGGGPGRGPPPPRSFPCAHPLDQIEPL